MQLLARVRLEQYYAKRLTFEVRAEIDLAKLSPEVRGVHDQQEVNVEDRRRLHLQESFYQFILLPLQHQVCLVNYKHELNLL